MEDSSRRVLTLASVGAVVVTVLFASFAHWGGVGFSIDPTKLPNVLAPLILAATFIERAVEVIVSPWRDTGAAKLTSEKLAMKKQVTGQVQGAVAGAVLGGAGGAMVGAAAGAAADTNAVMQVDVAFQTYKGITRQYAFAVSIAFSLAISFAGVRVLWPFVDPTSFSSLGSWQKHIFYVVDFVLTAALLSGGADGLHSMINAFTSFFNATAAKSQQSTN